MSLCGVLAAAVSPWLLIEGSLVLGVVLAIVFVSRAARQRRSPTATLAWVMAIVLIPFIGVPLYVVFGGRKIRRIAGRKQDLALAATLPVSEPSAMDRLMRSAGIPGATAGNRLTLCANGEEAYARLVELIDAATESICLMTYILRADAVGRAVLARLAARAREGVAVRVLLDGLGSFRLWRRHLAPLLEAGGRVVRFLPVLRLPWRGHNLRNHRKFLIADQRRVWAGGRNIAREYMGPGPRPGRYWDFSFVLEGPAVGHFMGLFRADWAFTSGEGLELHPEHAQPVADAGTAVVQVVPSGPDTPDDAYYDAVLTATFSARRRLWIVTPFFIPDMALLEGLRLAAHRGVDVRIALPAKGTYRLINLAHGPYQREVHAEGCTVALYTPGMLHAKVMLVDDDLAIVGSANMDIRSFFFQYEVSLFVYSAPEIRAIEAWVRDVLRRCRAGVRPVGAFRELVEGLARMLAPVL